MSTPIRIKRRWTGATGAPSSLLSGELAFNGVDNTLYLGFGDDGSGNATSIVTIAGGGAFMPLTGDQTIAGVKTFTSSPVVPTPTAGDNSTKVATTAYVQTALAGFSGGGVTDGDKGDITVTLGVWTLDPGVVSLPKMANLPANTFIGNNTAGSAVPLALTVSDVQTMLGWSAKADLASPAFSGTPTAPTAADATSNTQIATTAFVHSLINSVIGAAPAALDTLKELADAINDDANFAATTTTALATKLTKTSNLSDLSDMAAARTNLGLGSMATQNANAVAITGGTIDGVTLDGGTF